METIPESVDGLKFSENDRVLLVTLNRQRQQNALTPEILISLEQILRQSTDSNGPRAIVITGEGDHFCSGYDTRRLDSEASRAGDILSTTLRLIEELPVPVFAAIRGNCIGAGLDLALSCDIRIADGSARFMMPPSKLGIVYPWRGINRLIQAVGSGFARFMLYMGEPIDAKAARLSGLVQQIVEDADDVLKITIDHATVVAQRRAPLSIRGAKETIRTIVHTDLESGEQTHLEDLVAQSLASEDHAEALRALHSRVEPHFRGI